MKPVANSLAVVNSFVENNIDLGKSVFNSTLKICIANSIPISTKFSTDNDSRIINLQTPFSRILPLTQRGRNRLRHFSSLSFCVSRDWIRLQLRREKEGGKRAESFSTEKLGSRGRQRLRYWFSVGACGFPRSPDPAAIPFQTARDHKTLPLLRRQLSTALTRPSATSASIDSIDSKY